ncbi:hypothetical protein SDC9_84421 [bioreactor metagenome]|uniref:Glycosyltransferase 2-like domain-containing protein n=1 Tax=bioreactor metagenome TaxID=1076179 RepID=A0A644ZAC0_9ZZZZ
MGKKYLVNLPIRIQIWIRPSILKQQFEVIKKARPSVLFLVSDGPRNEEEKKLINESRSIVENIDWECTVYRMYENSNIGMYAMGKKARDFIFSKVDRCAFMEDDYIPSVSYFSFCAELLEKYKNDLRVIMINGNNQLGTYDKPTSDYFFSHEGSIWGAAYWKRTYDKHYDTDFLNDPYIKSKLIEQGKVIKRSKFINKTTQRAFDEVYMTGSEYNLGIIKCLQNQLIIVPTKNLISNLGNDDKATHSSEYKKMPRAMRKIFHSKTYEYDFPLKHPKYVMPDYYYSKQIRKILGHGEYRYVIYLQKLESFILHVFYGDFNRINKKIIEYVRGIFKLKQSR